MADAFLNGLTFWPMRWTRSDILHNFAPAPINLANREEITYILDVRRQSLVNPAQMDLVVSLPTRETPPRQLGSETIYDGASMRIEDILDDFVLWKKPTYKQAETAVNRTQTTRYQLGERVYAADGTPIGGYLAALPDEWLLKGGLNRADFLAWGDSFFTVWMAANRPFLSWQPSPKLVSTGQEE